MNHTNYRWQNKCEAAEPLEYITKTMGRLGLRRFEIPPHSSREWYP